MRQIPDVQRGCGTLVRGGFYAQGIRAKSGTLRNWTWLLGSMWLGGIPENLLWNVPPRAMQLIALPYSITYNTLVLAAQAIDTEPIQKTSKAWELPALALADHVGSNNYTPWSFAEEVIEYGPSRRIPEKVAAQIAQIVPIPIVFTHEWMPLVDISACQDALGWSGGQRGEHWVLPTWEPTWEHEGYGFTVKHEYDGSDHWSIPIVECMHDEAGGKVKPVHTFMPHPLAENVLTEEQPFGVSWVNRVNYVVTGEESADRLDRLAEVGIEPVSID